ncbi:MAG: anaerobic ribonucleoside-triphosphate reductase activating protein [archaeon]|nr:anaerobic ribonucleoside-triphosphate reductase activating protein [archaeon]
MKIVGFIRTTLLDWDGKVACTIYLANCNFRCPYCHNKEIIFDSDKIDELDEKKIFNYIQENSDFLDGVVISGGEPTINTDLSKLIKKLKEMGMKIKLDTNGYNPDVLDDLIGAGYIDKIAMDIKAPLTEEKYSAVTGVHINPEILKKSIKIIMNSNIDYEFRTTCSPIFIKPEDIDEIGKSINGAENYNLQQFRPKICLDSRLEHISPYKESVILQMAKIARKYAKNVKIRGI